MHILPFKLDAGSIPDLPRKSDSQKNPVCFLGLPANFESPGKLSRREKIGAIYREKLPVRC